MYLFPVKKWFPLQIAKPSYKATSERFSQTYIRKLHSMIGYGTIAERKLLFHPGEYRRDNCFLGKTKTTPPKNIGSQMSALIAEYESLDKVELSQILDFHVRFERIHPFAETATVVLVGYSCLKSAYDMK